MPLQATSGAASYDAFGGGVPVEPVYIEQIFSTYLYTGNATTGQSINNGIDLATKGGLLWCKNRTTASTPHYLFDTARDFSYSNAAVLNTASTAAQEDKGTDYAKPETNGFSFGSGAGTTSPNKSGDAFASWTFRKQPKFFDVVTYTGTGSNTTIAHSLGSVPGSIIVKRTDTTGAWQVYHRSLANTEYLVLNTTAAIATGATRWNSTTPTSSVFSLGTDASVNASGGTYVAYLFAHDAGGFGLTGTDNVISCGSFTTDGSGNASVNLGYEPQFWLYKPTISARYWTIYDNMRGWSQTEIRNLNPNVSDAEGGGAATAFYPTATGFDCVGGNLDASTQHIYIAIRRPMKVPTNSTSVFRPMIIPINSASATTPINAGLTTDVVFGSHSSDESGSKWFASRLTGEYRLNSTSTAAEAQGAYYWDNMVGVRQEETNAQPTWYFLKRAPSFFDEVCYTGTGSATTFSHNLAAVPELIIFKRRSTINPWMVYCNRYNGGVNANQYYQVLNATDSENSGSGLLNNTDPTSSVFTVGTWNENNASGSTYVAYLFATCVGVSKVGSYTGNGSTQTIDCGFGAGGARFVLIKRANSTGGWYVYDTARGMTTLTDPYLLLNDTAAESATLGSVTTVSTGFALNSTILAAINVSGGTYIFLAIA